MNNKTKFKQTEIGLIPEEWEFDLLKDYCSQIQYGFTQSASLEEVGPKFLRITDIQNSHVDWDSVPFCEISKQEHEKYRLQPNDIVIARTGASTGVNTIYKEGSPDSVFASYLIRIKTDERLDPLFTYYFLQSDYYKEYVAGILGGSAQPNANAQQLTEINLPIPRSVVEQSRIASILSSLDDKIELNRKMNANLEQIASALFKRWFVDFEFPVEGDDTAPQPPKGGVLRASGGLFAERGGEKDVPAVLDSADKWLYAELEEKAKEMRAHPTPAEAILWERLRSSALGVKFRRQHVIDRFIVDFYCIEKGLVIEVDGGIHETQKESDKEREDVLRNYGCHILRFTNEQVLNDVESVLSKIVSALSSNSYLSPKSPLGDLGAPLLPGYKSSGGRMVESELGEIPDGWRVGKLEDEFEIVLGQSPSGDTYNESGVGMPFYQGRTDFGFRFPAQRVFCTSPQRTAKKLDTLISVRAPVGDINMSSEDCCIGRGVGAIRKEGFSSYTLYVVKSLQVQISQFDSEGTVFGSINKNALANIVCVVPDLKLIAEFEKLVSCIDGQIFDLTQEIANLVEIRDSLLPRLMSGRIRVK